MSGDDDNHTIDYRMAFPGYARNRKRRPAQPPRPKNRELEAAKSQARIESRKPQPQKQISQRTESECRPRKSMLLATKELMCDYPTITVPQLMKKLERLGYQAAPVT